MIFSSLGVLLVLLLVFVAIFGTTTLLELLLLELLFAVIAFSADGFVFSSERFEVNVLATITLLVFITIATVFLEATLWFERPTFTRSSSQLVGVITCARSFQIDFYCRCGF